MEKENKQSYVIFSCLLMSWKGIRWVVYAWIRFADVLCIFSGHWRQRCLVSPQKKKETTGSYLMKILKTLDDSIIEKGS